MVGRALDDVLTRNRLPIWGGRFLSCKSLNQLSFTFGRHRQDDRPRSPECPHAYQMALEQLPVRLPARNCSLKRGLPVRGAMHALIVLCHLRSLFPLAQSRAGPVGEM